MEVDLTEEAASAPTVEGSLSEQQKDAMVRLECLLEKAIFYIEEMEDEMAILHEELDSEEMKRKKGEERLSLVMRMGGDKARKRVSELEKEKEEWRRKEKELEERISRMETEEEEWGRRERELEERISEMEREKERSLQEDMEVGLVNRLTSMLDAKLQELRNELLEKLGERVSPTRGSPEPPPRSDTVGVEKERPAARGAVCREGEQWSRVVGRKERRRAQKPPLPPVVVVAPPQGVWGLGVSRQGVEGLRRGRDRHRGAESLRPW